MPIVNTTMPITARSCDEMILAIVEAYPFCRTEALTQTAFGRPLRTLVIGNGPRKVIYSAAHHANEWITSLLILKFAEEFAEAIASSGQIGGVDAGELAKTATVYMVPMVDPDGVDLVVGATLPGTVEYEIARRLSDNYPNIPFPDGWKANLLGIDLNLQYPAGWLQAREIKFSQGFTKPGPRDYVGRAPLNQLEGRAMAGYTEFIDPAIVIAFHTQGKLIFWTFRDIEVPGAEELGREFARLSGYTLADVPYESSFAGYKDWFIQNFRRPGYTVEAGIGSNPLPIEQFDEMYAATLPIMVKGATG
jgi:g-D-glutamyl-meso-diaminopimelate peptidase